MSSHSGPFFEDHCQHGLDSYIATVYLNGLIYDVFHYPKMSEKHLWPRFCVRSGNGHEDYCSITMGHEILIHVFGEDGMGDEAMAALAACKYKDLGW